MLYRILFVVLVVCGIAAVVDGLNTLTQATQGVGILALGCFLAILARLAQAEVHDRNAERRQI